MKKTSILSLLWLAGLLTFVATPTFAQEVEESADAEDTAIVAEVAEDDAVTEDVAEVAEDAAEVAEDTAEAADTSFEDMIKNDPEAVENLNNAMDELLGGLEMSEEDRAEFEANFGSPEDRAVAAAALWTLIAGAGVVYLIIAGIWCIILIIALWKAFTKAGEAGWKAIIPIYNAYIMYKIAGYKSWFWYVFIIAFIGGWLSAIQNEYAGIASSILLLIAWIMGIIVSYKFARKYNWGVFTSILFVVFAGTGIPLLCLGFGPWKYQGKED